MRTFWMRLSAMLLPALLAACVTGGSGGGTTVQVPPLQHPDNPFARQRSPALTGYLYRPSGVTGPSPAVILLHGCDGLQPATLQVLENAARRYSTKGYAALVLDSYGPRGHGDLCARDSNSVVPYLQRAWDAAAAADVLVKTGVAARDKVVVQGLSAGGSTAMHAASNLSIAPRGVFAAAIAWYPFCQTHAFSMGFGTPLLILIGDADTMTPLDYCRRVQAAQSGQDRITLRVFTGVTHSYDFFTLRQPATNPQGHRLQHDAAATAKSWEEIDAFLQKNVR